VSAKCARSRRVCEVCEVVTCLRSVRGRMDTGNPHTVEYGIGSACCLHVGAKCILMYHPVPHRSVLGLWDK
jgi:hypothetical protein